MKRIQLTLAALALCSATAASQAAVVNVTQANFGVISPLPYSRSFGDSFTAITNTAGYTTYASSSHITGTVNTTGSIDGSVVTSAGVNYNFYDDYVFTMPGESGLLTALASAVSVSFGTLQNISNLQVRFYETTNGLSTSNPGVPVFVGWQSVISLGGGSALNVSTFNNPLSLSAGVQYALEVRGLVSGPTASYSGNLNVTPVPEPEGLALALAALGAVGLVASRRRIG